jgi:hypothetical protein
MNSDLVSQVVGDSYPVQVPSGPGRVLRRWVVRTAGRLPGDVELRVVQDLIEAEMSSALRTLYPLPVDVLSASLPLIRITPIDSSHLIVTIEYGAAGVAVADSAMILQFGTLSRLDEVLPCEDLQGLPWDAWFPLREARRKRRETDSKASDL